MNLLLVLQILSPFITANNTPLIWLFVFKRGVFIEHEERFQSLRVDQENVHSNMIVFRSAWAISLWNKEVIIIWLG